MSAGRAKRSLSQNFLVDPNLRRKLIEELEPRPSEAILEVGPGHGELTELLLGRAARVIVVEKDDELAAELETRWGGDESLTIVHGDALDVDLAGQLPPGLPYSVISNIPYAITSPLLFRFLELDPPARRIVATVQREVADRVAAGPASRAYGALSVGVQVRANARMAFKIGRKAFRPVPDVESAALVLDLKSDALPAAEFQDLRRLTRAAFGQRRKQLQKILRSAPGLALGRETADEALRRAGLDGRERPEQLSPEQFITLSRTIRELAEPQR